MINSKLSDAEYRFVEEVWNVEPVKSSALVRLCQEKFGWKKSTTYTVLKKLCEKGLFQNLDGVVSSIVSRTEFYASKSSKFVDETFQGSLPAFIAAFSAGKKLSPSDVDEIQKMIDEYREGRYE